MITCIIIDDQIEAIEIIERHIKNKPELTLIKTFLNPIEALRYLGEAKIDIVFIDVQMPHINGLDFIESLRAKKGSDLPKFVLITGYDKYALSGFEQGVVDYLLKPVGFKRFNIAIDRIISALPKAEKKDSIKVDFFFAEVNGQKIKLRFDDIAYIEGSGNYITVFGINIKAIFYQSLSGITEQMQSGNFIRVHKSYIVSIKYISAIKGNEIFIVYNETKTTIPIGATFKESLMSALGL